MSYNKRQKNRKRRQAFRILIIAGIFLYFLLRTVPSFLANNAKTILPEKDIFVEMIKAEAVLIKHETLIRANNAGEIVLSSMEGKRIPAGGEIATINSFKDTSYLRQELIQIEESIKSLEETTKETSIIMAEKDKIEDLGKALIDELQAKIFKGNYDEIYLLKDQLLLYEDKGQDISFSKTLVGQSLESLQGKKANLQNEINKNKEKYYASHGGIISYEIDGYEDVFLPKDFENYKYENLDIKWNSNKNKAKEETLESVSVGEPFSKLIDNFQWYLALKIKDIKEIEDFKINQTLRVYIEGNDELQGNIIAINSSEGKGIVIVKFTTMLHDYYNLRFPNVEVIKHKKQGYKIPNQAILDKEGIMGVYIKDKSGVVRFRPVNILASDSSYTYIDEESISLFDEIFVNPTSIKEGQILN